MSVFLIVFSLKTKGCIVIWGQHVCFGERFFLLLLLLLIMHILYQVLNCVYTNVQL